MGSILAGIARWLVRQAVALLLILAVLLTAAWIGGELKKNAELADERSELVARRDQLTRAREALKRDAGTQIRKAESTLRILRVDLEELRAERAMVWDANVWTRKVPLSEAWQSIRLLDARILAAQTAVDAADRLHASARRQLDTRVAQAQQEINALGSAISARERALEQGYVGRVQSLVRKELPFAISILVGILLIPIGIKVVLYFLVAPWVARQPPIQLLPQASGRAFAPFALAAEAGDAGRMSAVSVPVVPGEGQELLVQSDYLQSTSRQAGKSTRWLLNKALPFASLLSGLFMLTRVGPAGAEPIVISPVKDALNEVGILELEEGAAFVCHARSLAGVVQEADHPVRITRHWRLGSLQAWLTLQLRFLVFHGPCRLILKGCRGIRIESPGTGRLINQAATLGYSANLKVANIRCETFLSYWTGKEDLFNDLFTGEGGVYVYEGMPGLKRRTGITGRGLEGFSDAVLKVFGV